jgi:hypothetical protein
VVVSVSSIAEVVRGKRGKNDGREAPRRDRDGPGRKRKNP